MRKPGSPAQTRVPEEHAGGATLRVLHSGPLSKGRSGGVKSILLSTYRVCESLPDCDTALVDFGSGASGGAFKRAISRLAGLFRLLSFRGSVDILHLQIADFSVLWDALSIMVLRLRFKRIIAHVHCFHDSVERANRCRRIGWALLPVFARLLLVIGPGIDSQFRASWRDRVKVLPNFIELDLIPSGSLAKESNTIAFLGRMTRSKGIFALLDLAEQLRGMGWRLAFAGDFADPAEETEFRKRLTHTENAVWVGRVVDQKKFEFLGRAAVFVLPSSWQGEIFPVALLEAGAMGCAVAATAVGIIREVLDGGRFGVVLPSADVDGLRSALIPLLEDRPSLAALAAAWREEVLRNYTDDAVRRLLTQFYEEVLDTA